MYNRQAYKFHNRQFVTILSLNKTVLIMYNRQAYKFHNRQFVTILSLNKTTGAVNGDCFHMTV